MGAPQREEGVGGGGRGSVPSRMRRPGLRPGGRGGRGGGEAVGFVPQPIVDNVQSPACSAGRARARGQERRGFSEGARHGDRSQRRAGDLASVYTLSFPPRPPRARKKSAIPTSPQVAGHRNRAVDHRERRVVGHRLIKILGTGKGGQNGGSLERGRGDTPRGSGRAGRVGAGSWPSIRHNNGSVTGPTKNSHSCFFSPGPHPPRGMPPPEPSTPSSRGSAWEEDTRTHPRVLAVGGQESPLEHEGGVGPNEHLIGSRGVCDWCLRLVFVFGAYGGTNKSQVKLCSERKG